MFHVLEMEEQYRREHDPDNWPESRTISYSKPIVSIGLSTALDGSKLDATYFHGADGLGNVHTQAPQFTTSQEWVKLFDEDGPDPTSAPPRLPFVPSKTPSYEHILDILRTEEPDTVIIVAIGPLMNLAKAAEIDPETFSRVKHIVCMGGALKLPGNVTPYAEFNIFSDALAASRVFELTSLQACAHNQKRLEFTLFPLDITSQHLLLEGDYLNILTDEGYLEPDENGDLFMIPDIPPLVEWSRVWLTTTFNTFRRIYGHDLMTPEERSAQNIGLNMHDPLALWYGMKCLNNDGGDDGWIITRDLDLRVEHTGDLTRGMTVFDSRGKPKRKESVENDKDHGTWLSTSYGNRVNVAVSSPYKGSSFGRALLSSLFTQVEKL